MTKPLILESQADVALLKQSVAWFLDTQDPELDDAVYDRNDQVILQEILLPRIVCPFDPKGGTSKDLVLLIQCLDTAIREAYIADERASLLLRKLEAYAGWN